MKITRMLAAAGLVIASLGASTVANAKDHYGDRHDERRDDRDDHKRDNRHDDGRDHYWNDGGRENYRHDNGRHRGNAFGHRRCHTEYVRHRRVTRCYH